MLEGITCKLNISKIRDIPLPESWQVWTAEMELDIFMIIWISNIRKTNVAEEKEKGKGEQDQDINGMINDII